MFTSTDVKQMGGKLNDQIMVAVTLMEQAKTWLGSDLQTMPAVTQKMLGNMEVTMVMHVHGFLKRVKTRKTFPSLKAIAQDFAQKVKDIGGVMDNCPWELPAAAPAPPAASAQPLGKDKGKAIIEFNADGSLNTGQLARLYGMQLGSTVAKQAARMYAYGILRKWTVTTLPSCMPTTEN